MNKLLGNLCFWCVWPVAFFTQRKSERVRVALVHDGSILCIRSRCRSSRWQLPGGGIKPGETTPGAAIREVLEETGVDINKHRLQELEKTRINDSGLSYTMYPCVVRLSEKPSLTGLPFETYQAKWFPLKTVIDNKAHFLPSVDWLARNTRELT